MMLQEVSFIAKGNKMDKMDLPFFYQLGTQLNPLTKIAPTPENRLDTLLAAWRVRTSIEQLLGGWGGRLNVCRTSGRKLSADIAVAIDLWNATKTKEEKEKPISPIGVKIQEIINEAKTFEVVLSEELATISAYSVSQKAAYSMPLLVDKAEAIFPISVLRTLSPEIIREVRESGRCLAFDIPTATAFHMLRATEGVIHEYYLAICKPSTKVKLDNWGAYISALYKLVDDKVSKTKAKGQCALDTETKNHVRRVLALLQQVKDEDRNQIMHLEVVLDDDEALILFEITKGAIMAMAEKLPELPKEKDKTKKSLPP